MENVLLAQALSEISYLKSKSIFILNDLYKGYVWREIPIEDRKLLGRLFFHEINSSSDYGITALDKTSSNQQRYQKK